MRHPVMAFAMVAAAFFVLLSLNALRHGWHTPLVEDYHLTMFSSPEDVLASYGQADGGNYLIGAQKLAAGQSLRGTFYFACWPPGFMLVEAALLRLVPHHFVPGLFVVTAALWSLTLATLWTVLRHVSGSRFFPLAITGLFGLPTFSTFLFDSGIFMSESISIALFTMGLLVFTIAIVRGSSRLGLAAGLLIGAAALTRAQLVLGMLALVGGGFVIGVCALLWVLAGRWRPSSLAKARMRAVVAATLLYLGMVYGYAAWNDGGVVHMEYEYTLAWVRPPVPNWQDQGGIDVLCSADPKTCARMKAQPVVTWQEGRAASLHAILHHFPRVLVTKAKFFVVYFFSQTSYMPAGLGLPDYLENGIFLLAVVIGAVGCLLRFLNPMFAWLLLLQGAVWAGTTAASFSVMQFEVRYLYIGKCVSLTAALIVLADLYRRNRGADRLCLGRVADRDDENATGDQQYADETQRSHRFAQQGDRSGHDEKVLNAHDRLRDI